MDNRANLYFPFFYSHYDITESMSDADFGRLVRLVALNLRGDETPVPPELLIPYKFMVDDARRVFGTSIPKSQIHNKRDAARPQARENKRYGDFDAEAAFREALKRSYGNVEMKLENEK